MTTNTASQYRSVLIVGEVDIEFCIERHGLVAHVHRFGEDAIDDVDIITSEAIELIELLSTYVAETTKDGQE